MSYAVGYKLVRSADPQTGEAKRDRMAVISAFNRIASVACQRFILMMNNTEMLKKRRLESMDEVMLYLTGNHDDVGLSGDRGDFYRRKLAEHIYLNFSIEGVTHNNVMAIVESAMILEKETSRVLSQSAGNRDSAPSVDIDDQILDILARIADVF